MIFNIVYHTPDTITRTPEIDESGSNGNGISIEVQMAWGGSSTYNFQVSALSSCVLVEVSFIPLSLLYGRGVILWELAVDSRRDSSYHGSVRVVDAGF